MVNARATTRGIYRVRGAGRGNILFLPGRAKVLVLNGIQQEKAKGTGGKETPGAAAGRI